MPHSSNFPEPQTRQRIVAEARTWLGTPYHDCADIKGAGVDCGMLLARVFVDLGLIEPFDPRPYEIRWFQHNDEELYLAIVHRILDESGGCQVEAPLPGDAMVFPWGRTYSHGGIVTSANPLTIVHAYHPARQVTEEEIARNPMLRKDRQRPPLFFSYFPRSSE